MSRLLTPLPRALPQCGSLSLTNHKVYSRRNSSVLQSGERWEATARWNTAGRAQVSERLSIHEMELAADKKNLLLVVDVGPGWVHCSRHRRPRDHA